MKHDGTANGLKMLKVQSPNAAGCVAEVAEVADFEFVGSSSKRWRFHRQALRC
jgi:hypothetical protein